MTDEQIIEHPCPNCGVTLNGWSRLRHLGHYATHAHADCINNLRHRAEKAEAERDTAWNDAIEAAAERNSLTVRSIKEALDMRDWDAAREIAMKGRGAIRSLRKGEPT